MLMFLTSAGLGMFFTSLAIQYRDVRHGITFLSQMLMYAAPVAWPVTLMEDKLGDSITFWYSFYPMVGVIEGFRSCLLGTISMPWIYIINGTVASILIFFFGAYFYTKKEKIIADVF
jgi:lipopolysaccharide transport system permease protein